MPVPVFVRNLEAGPTVFTDPVTKDSVLWEGKDDVNGGDIQVAPESFLSSPNFIRAMTMGTFEIVNSEDHPEIIARLEHQANSPAMVSQRAAADKRRKVTKAPKTVPGETVIAPDADGALRATEKTVKVIVEKRAVKAEIEEDDDE